MVSLCIPVKVFITYFFIIIDVQASPLKANVSADKIPVVGQSEVNLATCTVSTSQSPAEVSWHLGTPFKSVREIKNTVEDLDEMYTVTSTLIGTPTVQMNQQNVQCVVKHSSMQEELGIDHKIVVHYPPQLVYVKPLKKLSSGEVFQCEADANPTATHFNWKRMDQTIDNDAIKIEGNKLYFLKLTSDLSGLYLCEASNQYGTATGTLYWQKGHLHSEL